MSMNLDSRSLDLNTKTTLNGLKYMSFGLGVSALVIIIFNIIAFFFLAVGEDDEFLHYRYATWYGIFAAMCVVLLIVGISFGVLNSDSNKNLTNSAITLADSMTAMYTKGVYEEGVKKSLNELITPNNRKDDKDHARAVKSLVGESMGNLDNLKNRINYRPLGIRSQDLSGISTTQL